MEVTMNTAAISGSKPNFDATIYDYKGNSAAQQLFSNCDPAINMTKPLMELGESAAAILSNLNVKFMGISNHQNLGSAARVDRYIFLLARDFISKEGTQEHLKEYTVEESGILSKFWYMVTYPKYLVVSDPKVANCKQPDSKLGREDYVFCEQIKAHAAEVMTHSIKKECHLNGPSLVPEKYLENMGQFIRAAEDGKLGLSITPNKVRLAWEDNFKADFCQENPLDEIYCSDKPLGSPSDAEDYFENMLPHVSMPQKVKGELEKSFSEDPAPIKVDKDEL